MKTPSQLKLDLLACRPVRAVALWPGFPVVLQAAALAVIVVLVATGFGVGPGMQVEELLTLRKTNLTTLVVWGLWWPSMIAVALALGRAWCTVCPMELVNRTSDAVARKLGWPRLRLSKFVRAGWFIMVLYLTLQLLVAGLSIHRMPHFTAIMLLVLVVGALLTGLVLREPRSFCRAFCPAGAMLSVYGTYTPIKLEIREPSICERCATKDCVRAENRYRFDKRSCPSLLQPFDRQPSDGCVLCFQCAKVCPHGNVGFGLVSDSAPVGRKSVLRPYEAAFVMIALGFVSHEVIGEVTWLEAIFHAAPAALGKLMPTVPFGWLEAFWFLVLFPFVVWVVIGAVGYAAGHRAGLRSLLLAAATGAAPVVAVAHLAKAAAKITSWGGFLPLALRDPQGLDTLQRVADRSLVAPASLLGLTVVGWVTLALTAVMALKAWRWARQIPSELATAARVGLAGAAVLFSAVLTAWSWPGL
jgi:polyferredoxin